MTRKEKKQPHTPANSLALFGSRAVSAPVDKKKQKLVQQFKDAVKSKLSSKEILEIFQQLKADYEGGELEIRRQIVEGFRNLIFSPEAEKLQIVIEKASFPHLMHIVHNFHSLVDQKHKYLAHNLNQLLMEIDKRLETIKNTNDLASALLLIIKQDSGIKNREEAGQSPLIARLLKCAKEKHGLSETQVYEFCFWLCVLGADVPHARKLIDKFGVNINAPSVCFQSNSSERTGGTMHPLYGAILSPDDHQDNMLNLFLEYKVDVNVILTGKTKPEQRIIGDEVKDVGTQNKGIVHLIVPYGSTPLMIAAREGRFSKVMKLHQNGAHVNLQNFEGETALMYAATQGHLDIVKHLLKIGADPFLTNIESKSALDLAASDEVRLEISKYMLNSMMEGFANSDPLKMVIPDLINQIKSYIVYREHEIFINFDSLLDLMAKKSGKVVVGIKERLRSEYAGMADHIKLTQELLDSTLQTPPKWEEEHSKWKTLLTQLLKNSQEYQQRQNTKSRSIGFTEEKSSAITEPMVVVSDSKRMDATEQYRQIVHMIDQSHQEVKDREIKDEKPEPTPILITTSNTPAFFQKKEKRGREYIKSELDLLEKFLKIEFKDTTSMANMNTVNSAIVFVLGRLLRKIKKLHEDFTATTVTTFLPKDVANHLANVIFHSHRSPLHFPGGNRGATLRHCKSVHRVALGICKFVQSEQSPVMFKDVVHDPLLTKILNHRIPDETLNDAIGQTYLVRRLLRFNQGSAKEVTLSGSKELDQQILHCSRCQMVAAHLGPYISADLIEQLEQNALPEHALLVSILPELLMNEDVIMSEESQRIEQAMMTILRQGQQKCDTQHFLIILLLHRYPRQHPECWCLQIK